MPVSVILVKPEIPENVGFVARTMKCFGLKDLRIVGRRYSPRSLAFKTGAAAKEILSKAPYFPSLAEALSPFHCSLGFTRRRRETGAMRVERLGEVITSTDLKLYTALVFGCESRGLSRQDCLLMNKLVRIELPNNGLSLNISHAVAIVLHEIFAHGMLTGNPLRTLPGKKLSTTQPVSKTAETAGPPLFQKREDTFQYLIDLLEKRELLNGVKAKARLEYLRRLWQRANPDHKEIDFLMGLIAKSAGK